MSRVLVAEGRARGWLREAILDAPGLRGRLAHTTELSTAGTRG